MLNILALATTGIIGSRLFGAVKVRWISVYSQSGSGGGDVYLQWFSESGAQKLLTDTSTSTAYPACIVEAKPPKDSLAGFWSISGVNETDTLFVLDSTLGAYVDVAVSYTLANNDLGAVPPTVLAVTGVSGVIGQCALDHSGSATFGSVGWISYS
jgi:hypothetical protein